MEGKTSFRPIIALSRRRLRESMGGRVSALLGALLAVGFGAVAIGIRADDGFGAPLGGLFITAAKWIGWAAGAPVALAAANQRSLVDRSEGIEALAASRGVPRPALESARTAAAMAQISTAIGAPLVGLVILSLVTSGSVASAARDAIVGVSLALFSCIVGVIIGGLAAISGRSAGPNGRWVLAAIIVLPWVLSDLFGYRSWSIPGAFDAALSFLLRFTSGGGAGL